MPVLRGIEHLAGYPKRRLDRGAVVDRGRTAHPVVATVRAVIYARVSTRDKGQETANQTRILEEFANNPASGYTLTHTYLDNVTGSTADRAAFKQMFADAAQRKFDVILFWSLDRFTREGPLETLKHLE